MCREMGEVPVNTAWEWHPEKPHEWIFMFVCMWAGISVALSLLSGWWSLSRRFRASAPSVGRHLRFESGSMGRGVGFGAVSFGSCLFVTVNDRGIRLAMFLLFRLMHPPLFIPWTDVESVSDQRLFFWRITAIHIRGHWATIGLKDAAAREVAATYSRVTGRTVSAAP